MKRKFSVLLCSALVLAGCQLYDAGSDNSVFKLGQPFRIMEGDTAILEPDGARLHFVDVLEDSRCPVDVTCIWLGQAILAMKLTVGRRSPVEFTLTGFVEASGLDDSQPYLTADTLGYRITLLGLDPYPDTRVERSNRLVATFKVVQL